LNNFFVKADGVCTSQILSCLCKVGVDGRIILEWILGKEGGKVWNGFILLRILSSGGHLWTW